MRCRNSASRVASCACCAVTASAGFPTGICARGRRRGARAAWFCASTAASSTSATSSPSLGRRPFPRQHGLGLGELLRAGQEAERRIVREALRGPANYFVAVVGFHFRASSIVRKSWSTIGDDAGQRAEVAVALSPAPAGRGAGPGRRR